MPNTVWQAHLTHKDLGNGYRQCLLAPYISSIINARGQRQCTFLGFESFDEAYRWYQQTQKLGYCVALRLAQRVNSRYEVKVWGLTTEELMSFWRQLAEQRQQQGASCQFK